MLFNDILSFITLIEGYSEATKEFAAEASQTEVDAAIATFRNLVNRNQVTGDERNIDYWRKQGWTAFSELLNLHKDKLSRTQQKRSRSVGKSITLEETGDWLVVVPLSNAASCFHGKNTDWCTTKPMSNHYERYVFDNSSVLVYFLQISTGTKWAMVLQEFGGVEFLNQTDQVITPTTFQQQTGLDPNHFQVLAQKVRSNPEFQAIHTQRAEDVEYIQEWIQTRHRNPELEKVLWRVRNIQLILTYCINTGYKWSDFEQLLLRAVFDDSKPIAITEYAIKVKRARWPEAEQYILHDPYSATRYAKDVIGGRWLEAEAKILTNAPAARLYAEQVIKAAWPEAESVLATSPDEGVAYAINVLHSRWLPVEKSIITQAKRSKWGINVAVDYAIRAIKARWEQLEPILLKNIANSEVQGYIQQYVAQVGTWPALDEVLPQYPKLEQNVHKRTPTAN